MTMLVTHTLAAVVLCASAGSLMVVTGLREKVLRRKEAQLRCPTCGRTDRQSCACRR